MDCTCKAVFSLYRKKLEFELERTGQCSHESLCCLEGCGVYKLFLGWEQMSVYAYAPTQMAERSKKHLTE